MPHGRRLFSPRTQHPSGLKTVPASLLSSPPPPSSLDDFEAAANRTVELIATRASLLRQVARIDQLLENERDIKRRALTARYERELRALDDEADDLVPQLSPQSDADSAAPIIRRSSSGSHGNNNRLDHLYDALHVHDDHNDHSDHGEEHQHHVDVHDIDIDVVLNHIDADGNGIISRAEVQGASTGARAMQLARSPMLLGASAGILCYIICRLVACRMGWGARRSDTERPAASIMRVGKPAGGTASVAVGGEALKRRKHGGKEQCGPAIAC